MKRFIVFPGIGKETARVLAKYGGNVYLACRDLKKCESAAREVSQSTGNKNVHAFELNLASFKSIKVSSNPHCRL